MKNQNKVSIKDLFTSMQKEMSQSLISSRENIPHPGSKGDATENEWIEWLSKYLPKRYKVDKAFVIDHEGTISEQIDVVIYDQQYSPFVFLHKGIIYIPAESVYAILEVKQELDKSNIEYASKKIASVRKLKRTSAPIVHAGGKIITPKAPFKIIGGILTTKSGWSPSFGQSFTDVIMSCLGEESIEIGCAITDGAFSIEEDVTDRILKISDKDEVLVFLFLQLLNLLQSKGTVPAMDVSCYAKYLKSFN